MIPALRNLSNLGVLYGDSDTVMTAADSVLGKRTTAEKDGQEAVPTEDKALMPYVVGQAGGNQKCGKVIV